MDQQNNTSNKSKKTTNPKRESPASRGGARAGSGRKSGSGAFGEITVPMRVPKSIAEDVENVLEAYRTEVSKAKEKSKAVASFDLASLGGKPLPSVGNVEGKPLDLGKTLGADKESSFAWIASAGFEAFGIYSGDFVVVDRSAKAEQDSICLCWTEESIALQRGGDALQPWGVVVALARKL